jgi:hypothetical protein
VVLGVDERVAFCDALVAAGLPVVEVGAFVSPKWVPQMRGSDEVTRRVARRPGVRLPVLVPNRQGFEAARAAGAREIAVFTAASETFNRKNTNASIDESFARFAEFVPEAKAEGLWVRGYVSTCFGCPYEGRVDPARVVEVATRLSAAGCDEISIGDTIGVAVPSQVHTKHATGGAAPVDDGHVSEDFAVHDRCSRGSSIVPSVGSSSCTDVFFATSPISLFRFTAAFPSFSNLGSVFFSHASRSIHMPFSAMRALLCVSWPALATSSLARRC